MENACISGTALAHFLSAYNFYIHEEGDAKTIFSRYVAEIIGQLFRSKKSPSNSNFLTLVQALYSDLQATKAPDDKKIEGHCLQKVLTYI